MHTYMFLWTLTTPKNNKNIFISYLKVPSEAQQIGPMILRKHKTVYICSYAPMKLDLPTLKKLAQSWSPRMLLHAVLESKLLFNCTINPCI